MAIAANVKADTIYFLICGIQIPIWYFGNTFSAIAYATKPHVQSYISIAFESLKVVIGFFTVAILNLGLFGAIISIILAQLFQTLYTLYFIRDKIAGSFNKAMAKKWLTISWIPIYGSMVSLVLSLNVIIVSNLPRSTLPAAYIEAPASVLGAVSYSSLVAYALYPKLLSHGSGRDVETSLKLVLLFAIPLTVGAFILAKPLLCVLRVQYAATDGILRVMSIATFFSCVSSVFESVITGAERVELKEDATFRDYVKSGIFLLPTLSYVQALFYIPSLFFITYYFVSRGLKNYLLLVFYCSLSQVITTVPIVFYKWHRAKKMMHFNFPWSSVTKFLIAASVMSIFLLIFYPYQAVSEIIGNVLSALTPVIAIGALIYLGIVYAIDRDFRSLVSSIITYFKNPFKSNTNKA
jgi:hypothetical protein